MSKERRRSPRVRQRADCEIHLGKKIHPATLLDVSEGGLALVCVDEMPVGAAGKISFRVMGSPIEVKALVWHSREVRFRGEPAFAYGFMVEESSESFLQLIPAPTGEDSTRASRATSRSAPPKKKDVAPRREKKAFASALAPATGSVEARVASARSARADGAKGKRLNHLRAELDDSLRETRKQTQGSSFRVRAKMRTQPRTRTLTLSVASEAEARAAVQESLGAEWEILEVSRP